MKKFAFKFPKKNVTLDFRNFFVNVVVKRSQELINSDFMIGTCSKNVIEYWVNNGNSRTFNTESHSNNYLWNTIRPSVPKKLYPRCFELCLQCRERDTCLKHRLFHKSFSKPIVITHQPQDHTYRDFQIVDFLSNQKVNEKIKVTCIFLT